MNSNTKLTRLQRRKLKRTFDDTKLKRHHYFELLDFDDLPEEMKPFLRKFVYTKAIDVEEYNRLKVKFPKLFIVANKEYFKLLKEYGGKLK